MPKRKVNIFEQERNNWQKQMKVYERTLRPIFFNALKKSIEPVKEWIRTARNPNAPVAILIDKSVWQKVYKEAYQTIGVRAARKEYTNQRRLDGMEDEETKAVGLGFLIDVWSGLMADYANQYSVGMSNKLNHTTIEIISKALGEDYGLEVGSDGWIRLVERQIDGAMKVRTNRLSRTEGTTIANIGKETAAQQWIDESGEEGYRMWLGRVINERPEHLEVNNTILKMNELYEVGGIQCLRPGDVSLPPSLRINCQCTQSLMSARRYKQYEKRGLIQNGKVTE